MTPMTPASPTPLLPSEPSLATRLWKAGEAALGSLALHGAGAIGLAAMYGMGIAAHAAMNGGAANGPIGSAMFLPVTFSMIGLATNALSSVLMSASAAVQGFKHASAEGREGLGESLKTSALVAAGVTAGGAVSVGLIGASAMLPILAKAALGGHVGVLSAVVATGATLGALALGALGIAAAGATALGGAALASTMADTARKGGKAKRGPPRSAPEPEGAPAIGATPPASPLALSQEGLSAWRQNKAPSSAPLATCALKMGH